MESILIPLGVCCVLPIATTFIIFFYMNKMTESKTNLLSKAIESGTAIDPQALLESLKSKKIKVTTIKERLINRLIWGVIAFVLGITAFVCLVFDVSKLIPDDALMIPGIIGIAAGTALFVSYFVGKNLLATEIEAETKMYSEKAKSSK